MATFRAINDHLYGLERNPILDKSRASPVDGRSDPAQRNSPYNGSSPTGERNALHHNAFTSLQAYMELYSDDLKAVIDRDTERIAPRNVPIGDRLIVKKYSWNMLCYRCGSRIFRFVSRLIPGTFYASSYAYGCSIWKDMAAADGKAQAKIPQKSLLRGHKSGISAHFDAMCTKMLKMSE